jgi:phospholipid transport system substrate-binding protein
VDANVVSVDGGVRPGAGSTRAWLAAMVMSLFVSMAAPAAAMEPAVQFMDRVAKDMIAASRTRSPAALQAVITRYGDMRSIGLYALGDYRPRLETADQEPYTSGMIRFISRYAANEAPKYVVKSVKFSPEIRRARYGLMVDSTVMLEDGSSYEVAWMLVQQGSTYRVRDAQVMGLWMTPFLKKLFEDYIAQNNGSVKALVAVLQRH